MPVLLIDEVLRRAAQGRTAPYLCRADDGQLYFVKHRALSRRERASEWLSAHLAQALGLSVPGCCLAEVPAALVAPSMGAWLADLGPGSAFASRHVESTEPTSAQLRQVPAALRERIAAFDWWVHNLNRAPTPRGGNPNLRWRTDPDGQGQGQVLLIDHSLAFDPRFDALRFQTTHVFGADFVRLAADFIDRERLRAEFVDALELASVASAAMPAAWRQADFRSERPMLALLERCRAADVFWTCAS
ncbi:MAG: hypothetical protein KAX42_02630 [Sphaerotilus sp.]|nr:hypothetical protein [Sphaerotilus sp.]